MKYKFKAGTIVKIPHLKGKSKEDADTFLKLAGDPFEYYMHLINGDWYLERVTNDQSDFEDTYNTSVSGISFEMLKEYTEEVIKTVEFIEPEYYKRLKDWCNPKVYYFVGEWKDVENAYKCLLKMTD